MPSHPPQWTDFLQCSSCGKDYSLQRELRPISLLCGHTVCQKCIATIYKDGCQYDQNALPSSAEERKIPLPINFALLQIISHQSDNSSASYHSLQELKQSDPFLVRNNDALYQSCSTLIEKMSTYLQSIKGGILPQNSELTKPMLRKLVTLIQCQIALREGRVRALRACRAIGERVATELILAHQNPATLSSNLWTAVRARGCQFLGPAMQEEALRLILLALEDGSELSRKVLVKFVVQRLQQQFPQASKTSIGHVVQLLYRASCFVVKKLEGDSSLMKLKTDYRMYSALRREHDAQVVQIAREAGLRIAPDQWSALLYGDQGHKPHMQSIIDRLQSTETLSRCIQDLKIALEKSKHSGLKGLIPSFEILAQISEDGHFEPSSLDTADGNDDWNVLQNCLQSVDTIINKLIIFSKNHSHDLWKDEELNARSAKYKTSLCRDIKNKGRCPRGASCTFAHTEEELHKYRTKRKKANIAFAGSSGTAQKPKSPEQDLTTSRARDNNPADSNFANKTVANLPDQLNNTSGHPAPRHQDLQQFYHSQPLVSNYLSDQQQFSSHQSRRISPMVQVDQQQLRNQNVPISPIPYGQPYNQNPYYHPQRSISPYNVHPPPQNPGNIPGGSESIFLKAGQNYVSNGAQRNFTVTLSFQATPDQQNASGQTVHLSNANITEIHPTRPTGGDRDKGKYPAPAAQQPVDGEPYQTGFVANEPQQMAGYHPGQMVSDPNNYLQQVHTTPETGIVPPGNTHPPGVYHPEPHLFGSQNHSDNPRIAVVAPQPVISPQASPGVVYDPNYPQQMYRQSTPMGHNIGSPVVLAPSPSPNQAMYMPVMQMQTYQAFDQPPFQQMIPLMQPHAPQPSPLVHSGAIYYICEQEGSSSGTSASMDKRGIAKSASLGERGIAKSIEHASVGQLERRKMQILQQMIQNQKGSPEPRGRESMDTSFHDLCRGFGGAATVPENLADEIRGIGVDVTAELDTGTKQVTVRGANVINSSHARDKRILDDDVMHQMLVEKNIERSIQSTKATMTSSMHPTVSRFTCASTAGPDMDDEMIPFSDRPTVSKYGPIARSVRNRPGGTDFVVKVNASADVSTHQVPTQCAVQQSSENPPIRNIYSSLENFHAVSCFPMAVSTAHEVRLAHNVSQSVGSNDISLMSPNSSLSQAASNSRLLRREQVALQQNETLGSEQDLELVVELQQIELELQQKKRHRN